MAEQTEQARRSLWTWLSDETNRKVLAMLGAGAVPIATGLWVAYTHFDKKSAAPAAAEAPPASTQTITILKDGTVAGRDLNTGTIVGQPADSSETEDQGPISTDIVIGGDGVVGGRDVNTGDIRFGD
mgnify:CR=1 FL=1